MDPFLHCFKHLTIAPVLPPQKKSHQLVWMKNPLHLIIFSHVTLPALVFSLYRSALCLSSSYFSILYAALRGLHFYFSSFSAAPYACLSRRAFLCLLSDLGSVACGIFHSAWLSQRMHPYYIIAHTQTHMHSRTRSVPTDSISPLLCLFLPHTPPDLMKKHERC